jgi:small-conductance mechanosensitive channel
MLIKLYALITLLVSIFGGIYYAYNHYVELKNELELKTTEAIRYKESLKDNEVAINVLTQQNIKIQNETLRLQQSLQKAEEYNTDLQRKLNDHNLTKLSSKKPGLIEKRVNDATSKIFKELEEITASSSS